MFVDVIVPLPLPELYTYSVPNELSEKIKVGCRLIVQFGKKKFVTGIASKIHNNKPKHYETKPVSEVLDLEPIVNTYQLQFWDWIRSYYMCTLGEVYKAALPSGLKLESETKILFTEADKEIKLTDNENLVIQIIKNNKAITISELVKSCNLKNVQVILKNLLEKKLIDLEEKLIEGYKTKKETFVVLTPEFGHEFKLNALLEELNRAPKQFQLVAAYLTLSKFLENKTITPVKQVELLQKAQSTSAALNALIKKGVFNKAEQEVSRLQERAESSNIKELSKAQSGAFEEINTAFNTSDVCLLHGVTSSGKTEIYIHLIAEQLKQHKQVLYLLPEIAITTQIITRLEKAFGNKVGVYHSKFSDNERVEVWNKLNDADNPYQIILGVRSSVFLPFTNLGLVIIDEEHENTYKQFDPAPRYNARDASIVMAKLHQAKVLLGTATPSLETYHNVKTGKYTLVELNTRYQDIKLPDIKIVNLVDAYRKKTMKSHFSPLLISKIEEALENKQQAILFQNRRGYSPFIQCHACGWIPYCTNCDVSLTYHKHFNKLSCHYCGQTSDMPMKCQACGSPGLTLKGFGTEKIEDEMSIYFPKARIGRMDLDTTRTRSKYEKLIGDFEKGNIDILIGTQMVTKGLDFDNVSVVGILNADNMLNFPDFRAFERSFHLMAQVSGRAGRKNKQGQVIIQTYDPKHEIINDVIENNYKHMFLNQANDRKLFKYPPFYRLIKLIIKHKDKQQVSRGAAVLARELKSFLGERVIGPEFPVVSRIQSYYIKHIYIKIEKDISITSIKEKIRFKIDELYANTEYRSIQVLPDIDPY